MELKITTQQNSVVQLLSVGKWVKIGNEQHHNATCAGWNKTYP